MSAKGDRSDGRSRGPALGIGRRGYQVARPRSDAWLWILNAVVITLAGVAAAAVSTNIGHTVVAATYHFLLFYVGVLALIALTAEVGIGLVATDRIVMKPAARVTAQALHRAMGFGAMAFLIVHIVLEIVAGRSQVADAVVPFLDKERTFYLGLGTVASDMFIVIVMFGIFRARLSDRITPRTWRVIHGSAYVAWIFGIIHGLLAGREAKAFFGYEGFVYWCYGGCVAAVALALLVRFVAKDRARNEVASQPVPDRPTASFPATAAGLAAAGLAAPAQFALEGRPLDARPLDARAMDSRQLPGGGRAPAASPQRALPAALPAGQSESGAFDRVDSGAFDRVDLGGTGAFDRVGQGNTGPIERIGRDATGPFDRVDLGGTGTVGRISHDATGPFQRISRGGTGAFDGTGQPGTGSFDRISPAGTGSFDRPAQGGTGQIPRISPPEPVGQYGMSGEYPRVDRRQRPDQQEPSGRYEWSTDSPRSGQYQRPGSGEYPQPGSAQPGSGGYPQPG